MVFSLTVNTGTSHFLLSQSYLHLVTSLFNSLSGTMNFIISLYSKFSFWNSYISSNKSAFSLVCSVFRSLISLTASLYLILNLLINFLISSTSSCSVQQFFSTCIISSSCFSFQSSSSFSLCFCIFNFNWKSLYACICYCYASFILSPPFDNFSCSSYILDSNSILAFYSSSTFYYIINASSAKEFLWLRLD